MIEKISKLFRFLQELGIDQYLSEKDKRRVKLTNTVSILFTFVCFFYIPLFFWVGSLIFTLLTVWVTISYAIPLIFNQYKNYLAAKIWSILTINIAVFVYTLLLGKAFNIYLAYYPGLFMPFIYFERAQAKDRKLTYFFSALTCILFLTNVSLEGKFTIEDVAPHSTVEVFSYIMLVVSVILSSIGIISLNNDARFAEASLESSVNDKNHLISVVCHDIANPLSVSAGFTKFILSRNSSNPTLDEGTVTRIEKIKKANDMIEEIIKNVRMLEAHKSGKSKILIEHVDLIQCLKDVEFVFQEKLNNKNLKLTIKNNIGDSINIKAEKTSLTNNVLNNIISNAIKFSYPGSQITLTLSELKDEILVQIKDQGAGMDEFTLQNVFSTKVATSKKGTDGESGTGFGMPIVFATLKQYDAKIEISSISEKIDKVNAGTTIKLIFLKSILGTPD